MATYFLEDRRGDAPATSLSQGASRRVFKLAEFLVEAQPPIAVVVTAAAPPSIAEELRGLSESPRDGPSGGPSPNRKFKRFRLASPVVAL